jgi:yersiniabactin salicyl-AMP ligase
MDTILETYEEQGYLSRETIHGEIEKAAKRYPDKVALYDANGSMTYQMLSKYSDGMAAYFMEEGLKKGDIVLLQIPNCNLYVVVLLALLKVGIQPVLMLPTHRQQEIISVSNVVKPKAYIGITEFLGVSYVEMVSKIKDLGILGIYTDTKFTGDSLYPCKKLPEYSVEMKDCRIPYNTDYRSTALYLLSGGTTNLPKVIPRIHEAYVYNSKATCKYTGITENTVNMALLSTSHDFQLASPGILGTLYCGGTVVLSQTSSFDEAFALIEEHKVTFTCIVPAIAKIWADVLEWYDGDFSSLERMMIGAAKLDEDLGRKLIDSLHIVLHQAYGLGEGITCTTRIDDDLETILNSQGKPVSKADSIKIVDPSGCELPQGEAGELLEKGPYTFLGYYGNPELNKGLFDDDGYLKTGDKAYLDAKGNIVICGRVKEQINKAGENVLPSEVETVLRSCPYIREAAVLGMPDEKMGEKVVAVVTAERKDIKMAEIGAHFRKNGIASYKIPDEIYVWESIPYKNIGKADKKLIKEKLEEIND